MNTDTPPGNPPIPLNPQSPEQPIGVPSAGQTAANPAPADALVAAGLFSRLLGTARGWAASARAALSSVWASVPAAWAGLTDRVDRSPWLIGLPVGLLVLVIGLVSIINDPFKTRATQPAPAAVAALEADVVDLRGRIADLKSAQTPQAAAPSRSVATSPAGRSARAPAAAPTQPAQPQPAATWGATDLDRAIDTFTTTLQEPTK